VDWDSSGQTVFEYAVRMSGRASWGGGIEMLAFSRLKRVSVHVYERCDLDCGGSYKRISCFDVDSSALDTVHVL
jgi:hypothetical protein